jgi:hypothetical protein
MFSALRRGPRRLDQRRPIRRPLNLALFSHKHCGSTKMTSLGQIFTAKRCFSLVLSSLLLVFLISSQPHRVHHLFESHGDSHDPIQVDSDKHDQHQDQSKPAQTDCVLKSIAQNCHLGQVDLVTLSLSQTNRQLFHPRVDPQVDSFAAFQFLQRAPPKNTLLL